MHNSRRGRSSAGRDKTFPYPSVIIHSSSRGCNARMFSRSRSYIVPYTAWQVTSPSLGTLTTPTTTQTGVGSIQDAQIIDFTTADEGATCTLQLQVQMSGTVVGGNIAYTYPMWAWRVRSTYPN